MNRLKEIAERLAAITSELDREDITADEIAAFEEEVRSLKAEQAKLLADHKRAVKEAMNEGQERQVNKEEGNKVEERARALKQGRSITVGSSHILLPSYESDQIDKPKFRVVSELLEKVKVVNFKGGESHSVPLLTAYGTGGYTAEGGNANAAEPTFATVTIAKAKITAYAEVSEEVLKLPAADYEQAILEALRFALQKKIAIELVNGEGGTNKLVGFTASDTYCPAVPDASKLSLSAIDQNTLDTVLYGYGGDEEVGDDGVLILNKLTLKALAAVRGTNEKKRVYDVDYKNKTIDGIPYIISSALPAFSAASNNDIVIAYGHLSAIELDIFSDVEVKRSDDYKFKEGIIAYKGEVFAGSNVTSWKGLVLAKKVS